MFPFTFPSSIPVEAAIVLALISGVLHLSQMIRRLSLQITLDAALESVELGLEALDEASLREREADQRRIVAESEARFLRTSHATERARLDAVIATTFPGGHDFARDIKTLTTLTVTGEDEVRMAARNANAFPGA